MLKKTMTTVDFGGTERTEDYYFNLTRAEIMEMELTTMRLYTDDDGVERTTYAWEIAK